MQRWNAQVAIIRMIMDLDNSKEFQIHKVHCALLATRNKDCQAIFYVSRVEHTRSAARLLYLRAVLKINKSMSFLWNF